MRKKAQYGFKRKPEKLDPVSLTIPGESLTVRQIFARHRAGIIDGVNHQGDFDEDEDFIPPDRTQIDQYDLTSIDEAKEFVESKKAEKLIRDEILKKEKAINDEERKKIERSDKEKIADIKKESVDKEIHE